MFSCFPQKLISRRTERWKERAHQTNKQKENWLKRIKSGKISSTRQTKIMCASKQNKI